jgi:hypothetical protein
MKVAPGSLRYIRGTAPNVQAAKQLTALVERLAKIARLERERSHPGDSPRIQTLGDTFGDYLTPDEYIYEQDLDLGGESEEIELARQQAIRQIKIESVLQPFLRRRTEGSNLACSGVTSISPVNSGTPGEKGLAYILVSQSSAALTFRRVPARPAGNNRARLSI